MRYLIIIIVALFALIQAQDSLANPISQGLVDEGRALLFDSVHNPPNPTYSGLVAANEKFKSAVEEDSTDEEANLFYALTRIAVSFIVEGDSAGIDTFRELLEAFGFSRNLEDSMDSPPYDGPLEIDGTYIPPTTTPSGAEFQTFLTDEFVPLIDSAISNLDIINSLFFTMLTAAETGDVQVEVDYGDVLFFKSVLYTIKAFIQIHSAYDMDINLRDAIILGNADVFQIQRDLLDKYNSFLALHTDGDGASRLTSARESLLNAISTCRDAFTSILNESSGGDLTQNDDLISFGSDEEVADAKSLIAHLTELQNSLNANRPYTENDEEWTIQIVGGPQFELYIMKDYDGNFIEGSMTDNSGFYAWINDYAVVGSTVSIEFGIDTGGTCPDPGTLSTTGTLNTAGDQITDGTFNYSDCTGSYPGQFTGSRQYTETKTQIDLNYLFGNSGKSPLDIRGNLPEFDTDNDMVAGTFPQPYLNNLIPEISTEMDLVDYFDIPLVYDVQPGSITLDGSANDWPESLLVAEDDEDDVSGSAPSGNNISELYAARDSNYFYWMMELYDPPANSNTTYGFAAEGKTDDLYLISLVMNGTYNLYNNFDLISSNPADMGTGSVIEARIPLDQFDGTVKTYANACTFDEGSWTTWDCINELILRLPNDADLSGSVICNHFNGSGKIFIYVYDGSDPATSHLLGTAVLDSPGSYTVTGLPIGKKVYVFSRWDADDNGIQTTGDVNSPIVTAIMSSSGTSKDINFSPPLLPGVMMLLLD